MLVARWCVPNAGCCSVQGTRFAEEGFDVAQLAELEGEEGHVAVLAARDKADHAGDVGVTAEAVDL